MIEEIPGACRLDHRASWIGVLPLMEFAYNNSYQTTIQMTLYKVLYKRKYQSLLHWDEIGERDELVRALGPEVTQQMIDQV